MTSPAWRGRTTGMRLFLLASAVVAIVAFVVAARRFAIPGEAAPAPTSARAGVLTMPDEPIPAEADVFRTSRAVLAIPPDSGARRPAHPRTLETFRALRAFPGAPPRIPHGLTPKEFQTGDCNTCHQRGGYSQRFGAYVPITPHPDMGACLQCHVGDAALMAIPLPSTDPSARCRQCHAAGTTPKLTEPAGWMPSSWPATTATALGDPPPPIPHTLQLRGNCLACHAAPAGVEEIRTRHPERSNCRQCHLAVDPVADEWTRAGASDPREERAP
jgi:cytochrome c-type protein NapB